MHSGRSLVEKIRRVGETLVNLQTGHRSNFLSDLFPTKGAVASSVQFRGWSPDGKKMALVISSTYMRDDRSLFRESDLVSTDHLNQSYRLPACPSSLAAIY